MAINLFKSRHPDLSADATTAFALLAISVAIGVVSVYLDAEIRDGIFDYVFFSVFVWACATCAVVFYGVDTVDREGNAKDRNGNFQWLQVGLQINCSLILSPLLGLDI